MFCLFSDIFNVEPVHSGIGIFAIIMILCFGGADKVITKNSFEKTKAESVNYEWVQK